MNRVKLSAKYAAECQQVIDKCGDDYKTGSVLINEIAVPRSLHPMLTPIIDFAYDIADDFQGEKGDKCYWELVRLKVNRFLANDWEPSAWWAVVMYGLEHDGLVKHTYGLSVHRQGSSTTYESGHKELYKKVKELAETINQNQTDEWFMYSLLQSLPEEINGLRLQSTELAEVTAVDWREMKY